MLLEGNVAERQLVNLSPNVSCPLHHELSAFQCVGITHSLHVGSGVLAQAGDQWGQYE